MRVARGAVMESMNDGVIVLDLQNRIMDMNAAGQQITGYASSEVIGQEANQIFPPTLSSFSVIAM